MLDPARLSIHQVTLLQQCSTPQFVAALARNGIPCTSLWRDKTRAHGVGETARLVADNGIGFGSSEFFVLRCDERLLPDFLFYYLSQDDFIEGGVASMGGAVGHQRVPPEYVLGCSIPLPPLSEQRRIVSVLDAAFAGLATATANTQKNLQNARELFDSSLNTVFTSSQNGWNVSDLSDVVASNCSLSYGIVQPGEDREDGLPIVRPTDWDGRSLPQQA